MKKTGFLVMVCLLLVGVFAMAGADVSGSLGANSMQEYKVNLQAGAYTVEFAAPGSGWLANVTYLSYG
jgi:hypothetical protein